MPLYNFSKFNFNLSCSLPQYAIGITDSNVQSIAIYDGKRKYILIDVSLRKIYEPVKQWIIKVAQALNCSICLNWIKIPTISIKKFPQFLYEEKFKSFRILVLEQQDLDKLIDINLIGCVRTELIPGPRPRLG